MNVDVRILVGQFVRYGISGGSAVGLHFLVLVVLVEWTVLNPTIATTVGFLAGCVVNYTLQHRWVFGANGNHQRFLLRYIGVTPCTVAFNAALFHALQAWLGVWYPLAQAVATGVVFLVNFEINRHYTFREVG